MDYDRFNNSLTKLREKKEKTLNDEKNLFKVRSPIAVLLEISPNFFLCMGSLNKTLRSLLMNMNILTMR